MALKEIQNIRHNVQNQSNELPCMQERASLTALFNETLVCPDGSPWINNKPENINLEISSFLKYVTLLHKEIDKLTLCYRFIINRLPRVLQSFTELQTIMRNALQFLFIKTTLFNNALNTFVEKTKDIPFNINKDNLLFLKKEVLELLQRLLKNISLTVGFHQINDYLTDFRNSALHRQWTSIYKDLAVAENVFSASLKANIFYLQLSEQFFKEVCGVSSNYILACRSRHERNVLLKSSECSLMAAKRELEKMLQIKIKNSQLQEEKETTHILGKSSFQIEDECKLDESSEQIAVASVQPVDEDRYVSSTNREKLMKKEKTLEQLMNEINEISKRFHEILKSVTPSILADELFVINDCREKVNDSVKALSKVQYNMKVTYKLINEVKKVENYETKIRIQLQIVQRVSDVVEELKKMELTIFLIEQSVDAVDAAKYIIFQLKGKELTLMSELHYFKTLENNFELIMQFLKFDLHHVIKKVLYYESSEEKLMEHTRSAKRLLDYSTALHQKLKIIMGQLNCGISRRKRVSYVKTILVLAIQIARYIQTCHKEVRSANFFLTSFLDNSQLQLEWEALQFTIQNATQNLQKEFLQKPYYINLKKRNIEQKPGETNAEELKEIKAKVIYTLKELKHRAQEMLKGSKNKNSISYYKVQIQDSLLELSMFLRKINAVLHKSKNSAETEIVQRQLPITLEYKKRIEDAEIRLVIFYNAIKNSVLLFNLAMKQSKPMEHLYKRYAEKRALLAKTSDQFIILGNNLHALSTWKLEGKAVSFSKQNRMMYNKCVVTIIEKSKLMINMLYSVYTKMTLIFTEGIEPLSKDIVDINKHQFWDITKFQHGRQQYEAIKKKILYIIENKLNEKKNETALVGNTLRLIEHGIELTSILLKLCGHMELLERSVIYVRQTYSVRTELLKNQENITRQKLYLRYIIFILQKKIEENGRTGDFLVEGVLTLRSYPITDEAHIYLCLHKLMSLKDTVMNVKFELELMDQLDSPTDIFLQNKHVVNELLILANRINHFEQILVKSRALMESTEQKEFLKKEILIIKGNIKKLIMFLQKNLNFFDDVCRYLQFFIKRYSTQVHETQTLEIELLEPKLNIRNGIFYLRNIINDLANVKQSSALLSVKKNILAAITLLKCNIQSLHKYACKIKKGLTTLNASKYIQKRIQTQQIKLDECVLNLQARVLGFECGLLLSIRIISDQSHLQMMDQPPNFKNPTDEHLSSISTFLKEADQELMEIQSLRNRKGTPKQLIGATRLIKRKNINLLEKLRSVFDNLYIVYYRNDNICKIFAKYSYLVKSVRKDLLKAHGTIKLDLAFVKILLKETEEKIKTRVSDVNVILKNVSKVLTTFHNIKSLVLLLEETLKFIKAAKKMEAELKQNLEKENNMFLLHVVIQYLQIQTDLFLKYFSDALKKLQKSNKRLNDMSNITSKQKQQLNKQEEDENTIKLYQNYLHHVLTILYNNNWVSFLFEKMESEKLSSPLHQMKRTLLKDTQNEILNTLLEIEIYKPHMLNVLKSYISVDTLLSELNTRMQMNKMWLQAVDLYQQKNEREEKITQKETVLHNGTQERKVTPAKNLQRNVSQEVVPATNLSQKAIPQKRVLEKITPKGKITHTTMNRRINSYTSVSQGKRPQVETFTSKIVRTSTPQSKASCKKKIQQKGIKEKQELQGKTTTVNLSDQNVQTEKRKVEENVELKEQKQEKKKKEEHGKERGARGAEKKEQEQGEEGEEEHEKEGEAVGTEKKGEKEHEQEGEEEREKEGEEEHEKEGEGEREKEGEAVGTEKEEDEEEDEESEGIVKQLMQHNVSKNKKHNKRVLYEKENCLYQNRSFQKNNNKMIIFLHLSTALFHNLGFYLSKIMFVIFVKYVNKVKTRQKKNQIIKHKYITPNILLGALKKNIYILLPSNKRFQITTPYNDLEIRNAIFWGILKRKELKRNYRNMKKPSIITTTICMCSQKWYAAEYIFAFLEIKDKIKRKVEQYETNKEHMTAIVMKNEVRTAVENEGDLYKIMKLTTDKNKTQEVKQLSRINILQNILLKKSKMTEILDEPIKNIAISCDLIKPQIYCSIHSIKTCLTNTLENNSENSMFMDWNVNHGYDGYINKIDSFILIIIILIFTTSIALLPGYLKKKFVLKKFLFILFCVLNYYYEIFIVS